MRQREQGLRAFLKRHKRIVTIVAAVCGVIILVQFLYPSGRALPLSRMGGDMVGLSSETDIANKLHTDYDPQTVTTVIRGTTTKTSLAKTGLVTDNEAIIEELSDYKWYWRVLPLSIFVKGALTNSEVTTTTDGAKFALYAKDRSKECEVTPKNASVTVKNGEVVLDPAKDGQACSTDELKKQLTAKPLTKQGVKVNVQTTKVSPVRSDKDVQPLLAEAKKVADRQLTLVVAGKTYVIDKPTLASWLAFPEDPTTKKVSVGTNPEAVKAYLNTIQKDVYIAPGTTVITTMDSIETGRVTGSSGRGIDMDATAKAIDTQVLADSGTVTASLTTLSPKVAYNRSYSKTPAGLQALVNDLVQGKDAAISVRKLGDSGVHANGDKQYRTASTYKMYVAYSVLKRIDSGQMNWGQVTSGGQTLSQCFDKMIVNSDNPCAEWFGDGIGWGAVTNEVRALGLSRTNLNLAIPLTTSNDAALFMQKLESGQLGISETSRTRLLDVMKRQVFRQGIPAGTGVAVADKVGFIEGYLHDAAIVYSPSGVYVLTIFTNNSSWSAIADMAKQIQTQIQ